MRILLIILLTASVCFGQFEFTSFTWAQIDSILKYAKADSLADNTTLEASGGQLGIKAAGSKYRYKNDYESSHIATLPIMADWTSWGNNPPVTNGLQCQIKVVQDTTYLFYEYLDGGVPNFRIGMAWSVDRVNWTVIEPLLSPSGSGMDSLGIADPTVEYIPWAEYKWHMWFDAAHDDGVWEIGHAWTDDPKTSWTKQDKNGDGKTDTVFVVAENDFWGYANTYDHAPESFIYGGVVHLINNVQGDNHTEFDAVLGVANDQWGLGYNFDVWGPITTDSTTTKGNADRLQGVYAHNNVLYALIWDKGLSDYHTGQWLSSYDGGHSWNQIGPGPTNITADGIHSVAVHNDTLWGVDHGANLYYVDLNSPTYSTSQDSSLQESHRLPLIHNTKRGYYVDGDLAVTKNSSGHVELRSGSSQLRIHPNYLYANNIGIGVASFSESYVLDVVGDFRANLGNFEIQNLGTPCLKMYQTNTGGYMDLRDGDNIKKILFDARDANGDSYFNAGNVAIGKTSASEMLDVNGNIQADTSKVDVAEIGAFKLVVVSDTLCSVTGTDTLRIHPERSP